MTKKRQRQNGHISHHSNMEVSYEDIITSSGAVTHCFMMVIGQSVFTLTSPLTTLHHPPRGKCYDSSNAEIGRVEFRSPIVQERNYYSPIFRLTSFMEFRSKGREAIQPGDI
ncbi:hypothetical protein CEXT_99431 [Caerostris extrusa]|uniref:Uncharacterized protein n=1 Tax=Caerostris extrusa TaxID=172846 RepID=A0AAV4XI08_CAEEX|nr:hypothetical protein CEXT_99431 [Caerostris extrusa]